MDNKVMIGVIAVVVVVIVAGVAIFMMNQGSGNNDEQTTNIEIKSTFKVGDTHVWHTSGSMWGYPIDEDSVIKIIEVNSDGTYQVQVPGSDDDELSDEPVVKTMTKEEIDGMIAPSIDYLNKMIREQSDIPGLELKKVGTEVKNISGIGDVKCDKYEVKYNGGGASLVYDLFLDSKNGIFLEMDADGSSSGVSFNMNMLFKNSTMIGVTN